MGPIRNRRVVVTRHGAPDVLRLVEDEVAPPGPAEVRVRVHAAGVSGFDLIYRRYRGLPGSPKLPFTLGEDVAGEVEAIGDGVSRFAVGERVAGGTWALGIGGGYTELVNLPESELVPIGDVDPAEAVCLVVNYLTAHQHLHEIGRVRSGHRVLVHGAAGGVGTALVQLAKLAGAEVYGTARTDQLELVSRLGATPIDYQRQDFVDEIRRLTPNGVDVVVDPIGGAKHLLRCFRTLNPTGRLVWLGSAAIEQQGVRVAPFSMAMSTLLRLLPGKKSLPNCPIMDEFATANPDWYQNTLQELVDLVATDQLRPVIAERVPLAEAWRTHEAVSKGAHVGKYVLVTDAYSTN